MQLFKRIFFFLLVNILVITTITLVMNILGIQPYLTARGLDYAALATFCLIWGMGGSLISLLISRWMAKQLMNIQVLDPHTFNPSERKLIEMVHRLSEQASLETMPEVGIFRSSTPNAFATGPSRKKSLVAVSTALLEGMTNDELEGVIGHELSHIVNGDMVTMTLLQGVINAFVMFLARALAYFLVRDSNNKNSSMSYMLFVLLFQTVFMILGSLVVCAFSRWREYRADAGSASLSSKQNMIAALQKLESLQNRPASEMPKAIEAFMINGSRKGGLRTLFATHPALNDRIAALMKL